ncbi:type I methionyl aminopeptidase [Arenibaculum pallidiluteum]|uniref:type I methionyl aminopeptidase n=1 Tax=Arenibaculum pallidiluteum TaxID=2812559 RepID=UPI001A95B219|nr:type I methionyl aminopeptidase [Arenibaculum pallidiluteum]
MLRHSTQRDDTGRQIPLYGPEGFDGMRRAGRLAAATLDFIAGHIRPGISTGALDRLCEGFMRDSGAVPATIGYRGYPCASCISVNHVVTHGIPSDEKLLAPGDILNIDVTPILDGWYGDSSRMYLVGEAVPVLARRLVEVTHEAMMAGITTIRPGATLGDLGHAIETVARRERFSVVRDFCGHGLGRVFHDAPQVVHCGRPGTGVVLEPGMIFTVEPMLNAGRAEVKVLSDGWTTVTRDRSLSAQFEHSVGVTETGVEIFTLPPAPSASSAVLAGLPV